jgi:endosialidase-like protein
LLQNNTTGNNNTAIGFDALYASTTGQGNTAIGNRALSQNTTGGSNTALGFTAGSNVTTATDVICIGTGGANVDNSCYIGNIFNQTSSSGIPVLINSSNKLGTTTSSKRFKEDIKPMGVVSEALFSLTPVTFQYKKEIDPAGISQFGLVAEDVEKVNPDLVVCDKEGKPYSVRYDQVNAMLLNEFLKEHHKVQEQQNEIEALKTELKEQRNLIQKVSKRVEMGTAAPQMVSNDQN